MRSTYHTLVDKSRLKHFALLPVSALHMWHETDVAKNVQDKPQLRNNASLGGTDVLVFRNFNPYNAATCTSGVKTSPFIFILRVPTCVSSNDPYTRPKTLHS